MDRDKIFVLMVILVYGIIRYVFRDVWVLAYEQGKLLSYLLLHISVCIFMYRLWCGIFNRL